MDNASAEMRRAVYYLVALIAANADRFSYHWLRQEVDGRWTHKPGKESG